MKPDMFYDLSRIIAEDFYQDNDENVILYKGHRLLSVDGSTINLPVNEKTRQLYGTFNNQKQTNDVVLGRVSIMYDVLNEMVLDGKLCPYKTGEIPLSQEHFKFAKEGDIIIMDRGYPSFESMYTMQKKKIHFIYRCKTDFSNQVNKFYVSKEDDVIVQIKPKQNGSFKDLPYNKEKTIEVRLMRIELSSGETEILMSSLLDNATYPHGDFKELYFKRWGIETYYNRFKNITLLLTLVQYLFIVISVGKRFPLLRTPVYNFPYIFHSLQHYQGNPEIGLSVHCGYSTYIETPQGRTADTFCLKQCSCL
jgi:hypothetical protein